MPLSPGQVFRTLRDEFQHLRDVVKTEMNEPSDDPEAVLEVLMQGIMDYNHVMLAMQSEVEVLAPGMLGHGVAPRGLIVDPGADIPVYGYGWLMDVLVTDYSNLMESVMYPRGAEHEDLSGFVGTLVQKVLEFQEILLGCRNFFRIREAWAQAGVEPGQEENIEANDEDAAIYGILGGPQVSLDESVVSDEDGRKEE